MAGPTMNAILLLAGSATACQELAGWVGRLRRGGVPAHVVGSESEGMEVVQGWGLQQEQVLAFATAGSAEPGGVWRAMPATCDELMQALVQHNWRWAVSGASGTAAVASAETSTEVAAAAAVSAPPASAEPPAVALADLEPAAQQQQQQQQQRRRQQQLVVGYCMKPSREEQLAAAGMLHLLPQEGMAFMPLTLGVPLSQQGHVDILLHKASDQLEEPAGATCRGADGAAAGPGNTAAAIGRQQAGEDQLLGRSSAIGAGGGGGGGPRFSAAVQQLQRELAELPGICVVDPFEATAKVIERVGLSRLLDELDSLQLPHGIRARAPKWIMLTPEDSADPTQLQQRLRARGMVPPYIVKPAAACGLAQSHSMALVLDDAPLTQLALEAAAAAAVAGPGGGAPVPAVPLPGVVQEFANHGGQQYKVYVLGDQVFYTPRASIPDVAACSGAGEALLCFDSLKSLPTQLPHSFSAPETTSSSGAASAATPGIGTTASAAVPGAQLDMAALEAMAGWLRTQLGLTLFGFDVVLPSAERGTYLVIDVNYFPNYRGGEGGSAAVALRRALRQQWERLAAAQAAGGARAL